MFGLSILENLFTNIINTKIVDAVYHSVRVVSDKGFIKPMAPVNGRFQYVGVDDTQGFTCYCRQIGPAEVDKVTNLGGCRSKLVRFRVPHRIIFFNQNEDRSHEELLAKLMSAVMKSFRVKVIRIQNISEELLKLEVPLGSFEFTEKTFYQGIDFSVLLELQTENCEQEIKCEGVNNPFRVTE